MTFDGFLYRCVHFSHHPISYKISQNIFAAPACVPVLIGAQDILQETEVNESQTTILVMSVISSHGVLSFCMHPAGSGIHNNMMLLYLVTQIKWIFNCLHNMLILKSTQGTIKPHFYSLHCIFITSFRIFICNEYTAHTVMNSNLC